MYLHIGSNVMLKNSSVIAIFDLDATTTSKETRMFLSKCQKENKIEAVGDDLPKSFVVTKEKNQVKVYISPISVATLQKRFNDKNLLM